MRCVVLLLGFVLLGACGEPFSNDDLRFLKALPRREDLSFRVPEAEAQGLSLGTPAEFPARARQISQSLNAGIDGILGFVDQLVRMPASDTREDDVRIYGPFVQGEAELVLRVEHSADLETIQPSMTSTVEVSESYTYQLAGRRLLSEQWVPVLAGRFAPIESGTEGVGRLQVDFEAARTLGQTGKERGLYSLGYDTRGPGRSLELYVELPESLSEEDIVQAYYAYSDDAEGHVEFTFAARTNIAGGAEREVLVIHARWAGLEGRADVVAAEGDLAAPVLASECWDGLERQTYFWGSVPELGPGLGSEGDCAPGLREAAFPGQ